MGFSRRLRVCILLGVLLGLAATTSQATLVNVVFGGTFTNVPTELGATLSAGTAFTGTFQYDSSVLAEAGGTANAAAFLAITDFSFSTASYASTGFVDNAGDSNIQMYNDLGAPDYDHISLVPFGADLSAPALNGYNFLFAVLRMDDTTENIFATALALPTGLQLPDFNGGGIFNLFFSNPLTDDFQGIDGTLTYLRTTSNEEPVIPEPATLGLLGLGLSGMAGALRRKARRG